MAALRWAGEVIGPVLVLLTISSVTRALIVPRPPRHGPFHLFGALVRKAFFALSKRLRTYEAQDHLLAIEEPVTLLAVLAAWISVSLGGFTLWIWGIEGGPLWRSLTEAGSSMFTLGSVVGHRGSTLVDFAAAGVGLVIVALQIGYLPTLYGAFNRRETLVTMLESRAGAPAWGPELLARHQLVRIVDELPTFYAAWEAWAADVAETHSTYPSLLYLRSPQARQSWIIALLAVLDSAALYLSLSPDRAPSQARLCIRMGFSALRSIAKAIELPHDPDPHPQDPIRLTKAEFSLAAQRLAEAGFPIERSVDEAWPHFHGWRVNYEELSYTLASLVHAPPAPWSGSRPNLRPLPLKPDRPVDRRPED